MVQLGGSCQEFSDALHLEIELAALPRGQRLERLDRDGNLPAGTALVPHPARYPVDEQDREVPGLAIRGQRTLAGAVAEPVGEAVVSALFGAGSVTAGPVIGSGAVAAPVTGPVAAGLIAGPAATWSLVPGPWSLVLRPLGRPPLDSRAFFSRPADRAARRRSGEA
jgi:hypothetical protein